MVTATAHHHDRHARQCCHLRLTCTCHLYALRNRRVGVVGAKTQLSVLVVAPGENDGFIGKAESVTTTGTHTEGEGVWHRECAELQWVGRDRKVGRDAELVKGVVAPGEDGGLVVRER